MADAKIDPLVQKTFIKAASPAPNTSGVKVREYGKGKEQSRYQKILLWGGSSSGKTFSITGLLELGLKVFVISTDFGGSGLESVVNYMERTGQEHLLENLKEVELDDYEKVETFIKNPAKIYPAIYTFDPDVLVWDGFSGWQNGHLDDYVLSMKAQGNVGELRQAGLFAVEQDWGGIKRGTLHNLNKFLYLHNEKTGKLWHKLVTALETDKPIEFGAQMDSKQRGPLVQGGAKKLIEPGFNVIGRCSRKEIGGKILYEYHFNGDERTVAKQRGYGLQTVEPADMKTLWPKIVKSSAIKG